MASASGSRDLQHIYDAPDLPQLRRRLCRACGPRGFWLVTEYGMKQQVDRSFFDIGRYVWDSAEQRVGGRRADLLRGLLAAAGGRQKDEVMPCLRWRASQKRPCLAISDAPARFRTQEDVRNVYPDFELRAADTLIVPLPQGRDGGSCICTVAEQMSDLRNVPEAVAPISSYFHMSRLYVAENDNRRQGDGAGPEEAVRLTDKERRVLSWAAAGKSHQHIAVITGLSTRNVRYHMDKARDRYGFATTQQAIVRAAIDYGFDPLGAV